MTDGWPRILRIMDEAFEDYLAGLVMLRKRLVDDMRGKLNDGKILDLPPRGAWSKPTPRGKRG